MLVQNTPRIATCAWKRVLDEGGSSVVEIALTSAIFLGTLIGVFEMTLAFYTYHGINEMAREGTRYAIVRGSTSCANSNNNLTNCNAQKADIESYVRSISFPGIDSQTKINGAYKMPVNVSFYAASSTTPTTWSACAGTCNAPGNLVKVQIIYPFSPAIPFFSQRTLNLQSSSSLVIAQ